MYTDRQDPQNDENNKLAFADKAAAEHTKGDNKSSSPNFEVIANISFCLS